MVCEYTTVDDATVAVPKTLVMILMLAVMLVVG